MTAPMTREELLAVLAPFYKTIDVMKSAYEGDKSMVIWGDDIDAVNGVMLFLEKLRDHGIAQQPAHGLKAGEALGLTPSLDRDLAERQIPPTFQEELRALRKYATPQQSPRLEREAVKRIVLSAMQGARSSASYGTSYAARMNEEVAEKGADAILALLSPDATVVSSTSRCEVRK